VKAFIKKRFWFVLLLLVVFYACVKKGYVSPIPVIAYENFITYGKDSALFSFTFKDGDGDIGLSQGDTLPPFNSTGAYYYDLIMTYYFQETDGSFHTYFNPLPTVNDTQTFKYRIPNITPQGQDKVLQGEIKVTMYSPYFITGHTVVKYNAFIYDRALHKSNVILTPPIKVQ